MRTRDDIFTEVLVRNNRTTTDGFITDTFLKNWFSQANAWAAGYHKWPFTEGKSSTTYSTSVTDDMGNVIVQYPEGWKADSVRVLTIGGKRIEKIAFQSFLRFIEDQPNNTKRIYTDYARQLYVNAHADVSGTLTAYGQYMPAIDLTDETGLTIFSGYDEEGNEAIVEKMTEFLKLREHLDAEAQKNAEKAQLRLDELWKRIQDEQFNYKTGGEGMFEPFDVLNGRGSSNDYKENQF